MLTPRHLATLRAALLFWQEENVPHGRPVMNPYFDSPEPEPLSAEEIDGLRDRLRPQALRYALYDPAAERLAGVELHASPDPARQHAGADRQVVVVLLSL